MPSDPPIPVSENLPHGILLVEEYGALAVAISSALRKFASLHRVEVAHDFAAAEAAAARMQPELFVLDLDPPPAGEIDFLRHLQEHYPDARALVIAAGTSRELRHERGTSGAIQFIEKPFDLAEFGAAVQALVGPWAGPAGSERGTLRDLGLIDIMLAKCLADSSALVRLGLPNGRRGEIHFRKGQITHAVAGKLVGLPALNEMLSWPGSDLSEDELPAEARRTIDLPRDELLLPAIRRSAEQQKKNSLGKNPGPAAPAAKTGRKILVIDDTEMLLIFVADVLATADQTFQIVTTDSAGEGVRLAIETRPDLVLLDYSLADMTGDKVCRTLLENPRTARTPILMMSGHPTELARTAAEYDNVVATLPKPFLSGALINAVEKALAAGPLPKVAPPLKAAPPPPVPGPVPTPAPAKEEPQPPPLPNGHSNRHGPGADGSPPKTNPSFETATLEAPSSSVPAMLLPSKTMPAPAGAIKNREPAVGSAALRVTFSLEMVALRLTAFLEIDLARLEPLDPIVSVEMEQASGVGHGSFKSGFRLGRIQLASDGTIETVRLIPTRQGFEMSPATNFFAIGKANARRENSQLVLSAAPKQGMSVQLSAPFELSRMELTSAFEIEAVLVRACGREVVVRNSGTAGKAFVLQEVVLDPAGELRQLLVSQSPNA